MGGGPLGRTIWACLVAILKALIDLLCRDLSGDGEAMLNEFTEIVEQLKELDLGSFNPF